MGRAYDAPTLKAFVESGRTIREIAEDVGASYWGVCSALHRRGLRAVWEREQTLRQKVQGMRPAEAVEYLLACMETLAPALTGVAPSTDDAADLRLTPSQQRLFIALRNSKGVLSRDAAMAALYFDRLKPVDVPKHGVVRVFMHQLAARLVGTRYSVKTHGRWGWTLEIADE